MKKYLLILILLSVNVFAHEFQSYDVYLRDPDLLKEEKIALEKECQGVESEGCTRLLEVFSDISKRHSEFKNKKEIYNFSLWANKNNWKKVFNFSSKLALKCDGIPIDVDFCVKQFGHFKQFIQTSNLNHENKVIIVKFIDRYVHKFSTQLLANKEIIRKFSVLVNDLKISKTSEKSNIAVSVIENTPVAIKINYFAFFKNKKIIKYSLIGFGNLVVLSFFIFALRELFKKEKTIKLEKKKGNDHKILFLRFFEYAQEKEIKVRFFTSGNVDVLFIDKIESDIKKIMDTIGQDNNEIHFKIKQNEKFKSIETIIFEKNALSDEKYIDVFEKLEVVTQEDSSEVVIQNKLDKEGNVSQSSFYVTIID